MSRLRRLVVLAGVTLVFVPPSQGARSIVGGRAINIRAAPWTVAITVNDPSDPLVCTGVVLDAFDVVTAAHCLPQGSAHLVVEAGVSNFRHPRPTDAPEKRTVVAFRRHPDAQFADIVVLRLSRALELDGTHIKAIPVRRSSTWLPDGVAVLTGFGRTRPGAVPTGALTQVGVHVFNQGTCGPTNLAGAEAALRVCSFSAVGGACPGDSGAGLVSTGTQPQLIGILSGSASAKDCAAGVTSDYTYVGAPEVWRFIFGDDHPPLAPRGFNLGVWAVPPRVGNPAICEGAGAGGARVVYTLRVGGRRIRTANRTIIYTIRHTDIGKRITCIGSATNAGGTSLQSWTSAPVKPKTLWRHTARIA